MCDEFFKTYHFVASQGKAKKISIKSQNSLKLLKPKDTQNMLEIILFSTLLLIEISLIFLHLEAKKWLQFSNEILEFSSLCI